MKQKLVGIGYEPFDTSCCFTTYVYAIIWIVRIFYSADLWQFHHCQSELDSVLETYKQRYDSLSNDFMQWTYSQLSSKDYTSLLFDWITQHNIPISTLSLLKTDNIFNSFERTPYYRYIDPRVRDAILYLHLVKIYSFLINENPSLVWCVERCYLVKSIFAVICHHLDIPMLTLIHSRINNNWYFTDQFITLLHRILNRLSHLTNLINHILQAPNPLLIIPAFNYI